MSQYTPGPWRTGDLFHTVFGPKMDKPCPEGIATVHGRGEQLKARARLIAESPETLEALKDLLTHIPVGYGNDVALDEAVKRAEASIARVEGIKL